MRRTVTSALALAAPVTMAMTLAACGGDNEQESTPPKAAEPAESPPLRTRPVGYVQPLGESPEGLVADPVSGIVAAGVKSPPSLVLFRSGDGALVGRVALPADARHLSLERPGGPVLVPAEDADTLLTVSLPAGTTTATPVGRHPHDAAQAAGVTFVADEYAGLVSVVSDGTVTETIDVEGQPGGIAAAGDRVALVDVRRRLLKVLGAPEGEVLETLPAGAGPTHAVTDAAGIVYVVDTRGDAILRYELAPEPRLLGRTPLAGTPYGISVDRPGARLFVTQTQRNRVVELSIEANGLREVRSFPTVRQPNTVAVDSSAGALFVSGNADGVLQRIPLGRGR